MNQTMLALSLGFGGVILATQIAQASPQCGLRDVVTTLLVEFLVVQTHKTVVHPDLGQWFATGTF